MSVPKVNLFLNYVKSIKGLDSNSEYLKANREARRFYGSNKDYDYVKYVSSGSKEKLDYIEYSGNNEKSHGIFNENGLMTPREIKELRTQLRNTESVIWHGVISFTEEFGDQFCNTYEKAYQLMTTEFPKFFKKANLHPDNIVWFAGLHENTDNKHIHFSFFEKAPLRKKRNYKTYQYSDARIDLEAINDFKVNIQDNLTHSGKEIGKQRKEVTESFKAKLVSGECMKSIKNLIFILPEKGRLSYASENMKELKPQIDLIVETILLSDKELRQKYFNFERFLSKRDNELIKAYTKIKVDYSDKLLRDKFVEDLYRRLGNLVLATAKSIRMEQKKYEYETRNHLIKKRQERLKRKILIRKCMQLNDVVNKEIISAFQEYLDNLEEANFKRLKEEGILD